MVRVHVFISGRVQGVCFRAETEYVAQRLHVAGWVRNLTDGRVEAVFEGRKEDVEKAIRLLQARTTRSLCPQPRCYLGRLDRTVQGVQYYQQQS